MLYFGPGKKRGYNSSEIPVQGKAAYAIIKTGQKGKLRRQKRGNLLAEGEGVLAFEKVVLQTRLLDPRADFALAEIPSEIRFDPLTGASGRVAHFLTRDLPAPDLDSWKQFAAGHFCPFCPENVERVTPQFPPEICPEGRLRRGEALAFPNLSPYDRHSALTVVTRAHFPLPHEFSATQLADAFQLSQDYLGRVLAQEPDLHPLVTWNYLPPAGSSQIHPHLQVFATAAPGNAPLAEWRAEEAYRQAHAADFWSALLEEEKKRGERYLGRLGETEWLIAFRPYGVLGDVLALFPEGVLLPHVPRDLFLTLAAGLERLFRFFRDAHLVSFNLALYQSPRRLRLRFIPRLYLHQAIHTSDINHLQMLLAEPIAMVPPEEMAARIRPYFALA